MATINLRNIDDGLARGMKVAAATSGVTLKAWVEAVVRERIGKPAKIKYMIPDEECLPSYFPDEPSPEPPTPRSKVEKVKAEVAAKVDPTRHDPKTCRVYKCGACVASKGGK